MKYKKTLIVEGGGFKIAFAAGVVDTFIINKLFSFDRLMGVSGGTIVSSYYLSRQYSACYEALKYLGKDKEFVKFNRLLSHEGYMDIDYLRKVAADIVPLDFKKAAANAKDKLVEFVATKRKSGSPSYLKPDLDSWMDMIVASSTLPFATKGEQLIKDTAFFDGGWSDPLPVQKAYETGSRDILLIRNNPHHIKLSQSWPDYLGSYYFRDNKALSKCFAKSHEQYNESIDFINKPPKGLKIEVISPKRLLKSGTYSYSPGTLKKDYRYGLEFGLNYLATL